MRRFEEKEYKGFIIKKKGKQDLTAWKDGKLIMLANTEKMIKKMIDNREKEEA